MIGKMTFLRRVSQPEGHVSRLIIYLVYNAAAAAACCFYGLAMFKYRLTGATQCLEAELKFSYKKFTKRIDRCVSIDQSKFICLTLFQCN